MKMVAFSDRDGEASEDTRGRLPCAGGRWAVQEGEGGGREARLLTVLLLPCFFYPPSPLLSWPRGLRLRGQTRPCAYNRPILLKNLIKKLIQEHFHVPPPSTPARGGSLFGDSAVNLDRRRASGFDEKQIGHFRDMFWGANQEISIIIVIMLKEEEKKKKG